MYGICNAWKGPNLIQKESTYPRPYTSPKLRVFFLKQSESFCNIELIKPVE